MQFAFYFDNARCSGCKTCEIACKDYNHLDADTTFRRILDYEGGSWLRRADGTWDQNSFVYHVSLSCNHCNRPVCVYVCPTGAMHKDEETGLVSVNTDVCVGCGYCEFSCPYHAPKVSADTHQSSKCDGCIGRVKEGKAPICVEACLLRCLYLKDREELGAVDELVCSIAPLPPESETDPNLFIRASKAARESGDDTGWIANPLEI